MAAKKTELTEYQSLTQNLKRALKERGHTYGEIAKGIGLSESGVKKIFLAKDGSFQRLSEICRYVGLSLGELLEDNRVVDVGFTLKQQEEFQKAPLLFSFYWVLVYERRSVLQTQEAFQLTKQECFRWLRKLDTLGMIKLLPGDRVRLPSVKAVRWTGEGEFVQRLYNDWSRSLIDSISKPTPKRDDIYIMKYLQMTSSTYFEFRKALLDLEQEFIRRSIHEMRTKPGQLKHVRWLAAADNRSFVTGEDS